MEQSSDTDSANAANGANSANTADTPNAADVPTEGIERDLTRSAALLEKRIAANPEIPEPLSEKTLHDAITALFETKRGNFSDAKTLRDRSLRDAAALVERFPEDARLKVSRIKVIFIAVSTLRAFPNAENIRSISLLTEAEELAEKLKNADSTEPEYFVLLINVRQMLGETCRQAGKIETALEHFRRAESDRDAFAIVFPHFDSLPTFARLTLDSIEAFLDAKEYAEARRQLDAFRKAANDVSFFAKKEGVAAQNRLQKLEKRFIQETDSKGVFTE